MYKYSPIIENMAKFMDVSLWAMASLGFEEYGNKWHTDNFEKVNSLYWAISRNTRQ